MEGEIDPHQNSRSGAASLPVSMIQPGRFAVDALAAAQSLAGVVIVGAFLSLFRGLGLVLAPAKYVLRKAGVTKLILRAPYLALTTGQVVSLASAWAWNSTDEWSVVRVLWFVIALLGVTTVRTASFALSKPPGSLEATLKRWPERPFTGILKRREDAYFVRVILANSCAMIPAFASLLMFSNPIAWALYLQVIATMAGNAETLIHSNVHNHFFHTGHLRRRFDRLRVALLGIYVDYVYTIMFGRIPLIYAAQHVAIHHVEDNGVEDNQTTLIYERTSFLDFCRYVAKTGFSNMTGADVIAYFIRHKRTRRLKRAVSGMALWYLVLIGLWLVDPATAVGLAVFRLLSAVSICAANYVWHGLIDTAQPQNIFTNTVNFAPLGVISIHFSHIDHHLHPGEHWSRHEANARRDRHIYSRERAIVFRFPPSADGKYLFLRSLWLRKFEQLAKWCVWTNEAHGSFAELAKEIERRTHSVERTEHSRRWKVLDATLTGLVCRYLLRGGPARSQASSAA